MGEKIHSEDSYFIWATIQELEMSATEEWPAGTQNN